MRESFRQLYDILSPRDRRNALLLFCLILASALVETIGVATILPFIAVLADPGVVSRNEYLRSVYEYLDFEDVRSFLVFLGAAFFAILIVGLVVRGVAFWAQARFANRRMHFMSSRILLWYLRRDYEWFLSQDTSTLRSTVLWEVPRVVTESLFPAFQIVAHVTVVVLLFVLIVAVDPVLAVSVAAVLGGSYAVIFLILRKQVSRVGQTSFLANRGRFHYAQEAFGGLKDLKLKGLEERFVARFEIHSSQLANARTAEQLIGQMPSFAMQGVIFGGMLLVILYLMNVHGSLDRALPVIAMYAMAGYRMMPSLQNTYRHLVTFRNNQPTLAALHADLRAATVLAGTRGTISDQAKLSLKSAVELAHVTYRYPSSDRPALNDVGLRIDRYETVAFVGPTGCGKTTVVDVILGLLTPQQGRLLIDNGVIKDENRVAWQKNVGYVPQDIYLADATIAQNIAYGLEEDEIDYAAVERAARIANVHDFIVGELRAGYRTSVGERGVRLSGGQRQRIGIARALYDDPDVLVLDEATSALDNLTEQAVMEAVQSLSGQKTIILIAHRLSTVARCDRIFMMEAGRVVATGTFSELVEQNPRFRAMAAQEPSERTRSASEGA